MLVVTVELWPLGDRSRSRELSQMGIANISDDPILATYIFVTLEASRISGAGKVSGHLRADGFWPLIARAAGAAHNMEPDALDTAERIKSMMLGEH